MNKIEMHIAILRMVFRNVPGAKAHLDWLDNNVKHAAPLADSSEKPTPTGPPNT
jgi:propanediol dehydratase large subunit